MSLGDSYNLALVDLGRLSQFLVTCRLLPLSVGSSDLLRVSLGLVHAGVDLLLVLVVDLELCYDGVLLLAENYFSLGLRHFKFIFTI